MSNQQVGSGRKLCRLSAQRSTPPQPPSLTDGRTTPEPSTSAKSTCADSATKRPDYRYQGGHTPARVGRSARLGAPPGPDPTTRADSVHRTTHRCARCKGSRACEMPFSLRSWKREELPGPPGTGAFPCHRAAPPSNTSVIEAEPGRPRPLPNPSTRVTSSIVRRYQSSLAVS